MDLFLFHPTKTEKQSEMKMVEMLIASGKERFLIHPLIEIFLKLKWQKIFKLYISIVFFIGAFFLALVGYSLTHYGLVFGGKPLAYGNSQSYWW